MRVGAARAVAVGWVRRYAAREPGFRGALFSGSTVGLPDDAVLPVSSDVDVLVVRDGPVGKVGKFLYRGVLLEVSDVAWGEVADPEVVLGSFVFAPLFRRDTLIADPTGGLAQVRRRVSAGFAEEVWVRRRLAGVRGRVESGLRVLDGAAPLHRQVTAWLFPTSVAALLPVVAALRDPTVRRRYVVAREVLAGLGLSGRYAGLIGLLDGGGVSAGGAREHLRGLARTFDVVVEVGRSRFPFSGDLSVAGRPVVVDGARELIGAGSHREAMFWILATFARCHEVLAVDAPELGVELSPLFEAALADAGVSSVVDRRRRADEVLGWLPGWWETAEGVLARSLG